MAYTTAQLVTLYTNTNLGKAPDAATTLTLDAYATQTQTGGLTDAVALANTLKLVNTTTGVAIATYQFFTGRAPSAAGLDYLVDSTTNTNDLNDAYYSKFAQENRFIALSINLGAEGEGKAAFATAYTGVTIAQTIATAYDKIIGNSVATAAGVDVAAANAFFARAENITYLNAFVRANTTFTAAADIDLAVKAALIGQIMSAAITSGLGGYAAATKAMLTDLSDGVLSTDNALGVNLFTAYPTVAVAGTTIPLTVSATDDVVGASGNDTIIGQWGQATTLQASDKIDGGAGVDTLRIVTDALTPANIATAIAGFTVNNVEVLEIQAQNALGSTIGLENVTGVSTIRSSSSNSATVLNNVKAIAGLEVVNTLAAAALTVNYAAAAVAGTTTQAVKLEGAGASGAITANGVEIFNVTGSGATASVVAALASDAMTTVNIDGAAAVKIDALTFAGATGTVDGSKNTGGINVTLTNSGAVDAVVTGGTGNDRADFSAGFAAKDSFTGGAGTDTLVLTNAVATGVVGGTVSTIEVLEVSQGGTGTVDLSKFAGVNSVVYTSTGIATGNSLIGATTVSKTGATQSITIDAGTVANTLTTTVTTDSAADALTLNINKVGAADVTGAITAADADTVTLNIADDAAVAGVGALSLAGLTVAKAKAITVTNTADVTTTATVGGALLTSFDASASTGKLTMTAGGVTTALTGAVIKLGSADDSLLAVATTGTATGGDTITLGAGKDTVTYTAVAQSGDKTTDTITDFVSGTDKLDLTAVGLNSSALYLGARATFGLAQGALTGVAGQAVFQADTNTLWIDANANAQLDAGDFRIILTGNAAPTNADLSLGTGNAVALSATAALVNLTTNTNASNKTTNEADAITGTYAFLNGSTITGGLGTDTLTISGTATVNASALTSLTTAGGNTAAVTGVETITLNDVTGNVNLGANFGADVKTLTVNGAVSALTATTTAASQTFVVGNTAAANASAITLAHATTSVTLGAANDSVSTSAANSIGSTFNGGAGTDTLTFTGGGTLAGSISNFETLTINANSTLTTAQYGLFTTTDGNNTITFSDAGTATYVAGTTVTYQLAAGGTFVGTATANLSVTGSTGAEIFNFGTALDANDTIAAGTGTDVLNVTGSATTTAVSAIETINFTTSTAAQTLTTGASTNGNAYTITAAASTVAVAINATARTEAVALTIVDGQGNDTITVSTTEASAAVGVVTLSTGGSDTVAIGDLVFAAANAQGVTVNNFTTGLGTGADVLKVTLDVTGGTDAFSDYTVVTAAAQAVVNVNSATLYTAFEVNQAVAAVTNLSDVADGGLVEQALATAFGAVTNAGTDEALVVLYGAGAAAGDAGIYSVTFNNGADAVTGNLTVELVGIVKAVAADSFVQSNFG